MWQLAKYENGLLKRDSDLIFDSFAQADTALSKLFAISGSEYLAIKVS